jgi:hypothetical protein
VVLSVEKAAERLRLREMVMDAKTQETPKKRSYAQPSLEQREPLIEVTEAVMLVGTTGDF